MANETKLFRVMYHTPLGFQFHDFEAADFEEAKKEAKSRVIYGVVEIVLIKELSGDCGCDEGTEERGHKPPSTTEDGLDPCVVPSGKHFKTPAPDQTGTGTSKRLELYEQAHYTAKKASCAIGANSRSSCDCAWRSRA